MTRRVSFVCLLVAVLVTTSCWRSAETTPTANVAGDPDVRTIATDLAENFGACMRQAGFEYVALVPEVIDAADEALVSDVFRTEDRDDVARRGFGIAEDARISAAAGATAQASTDPNFEIYAGLTESDREAYHASHRSCYEQFPIYSSIDAGPSFTDSAADVYERTVASDLYRDAMNDWRVCMQRAGYDEYLEPGEIRDIFVERVAGAFTYDATWTPPFDPGPFDVGPPQVLDEGALSAIEAEEVAIAVADFDCQIEAELRSRVETARLEAASNEGEQ